MYLITLVLDLEQRLLYIPGQIHIVGEVECLLFLDVGDHVDERLVFGSNHPTRIVSQRKKHELGYFENIGFQDLTNESGLLDEDDVSIASQLDVSKHSVHLFPKC